MTVHNISEVSPEEKIQAYEILVKRLLQQAAITQRRYDFWKASVETSQPPEVIAAQQDVVTADWYRLEALEDACAPFLAQGFPRPVYSRPDFLADVKRLSEDPWSPWQEDAGLKAEEPEDSDPYSLERYRAAKQNLLDAAVKANWRYANFKAAVETGQQDQIAALQMAGLRAWFELQMRENEIAPFLERGFPAVPYERPNFEAEVKETSDPWDSWAQSVNLQERVNSERNPSEKEWIR